MLELLLLLARHLVFEFLDQRIRAARAEQHPLLTAAGLVALRML